MFRNTVQVFKNSQAKVIYSLPVALDVLILAALGNCNGSKQMAEYWKNNQTALQERWGIDFPKTGGCQKFRV